MTKGHLTYWILAIALTGVILIGGCTQQATEPTPQAPSTTSEEPTSVPAWMDIELTDVATGQKFKIMTCPRYQL